MRLHRQEPRRLKSVRSLVNLRFNSFGVNKKQEIERLLYEISKREDLLPREIISKDTPADYNFLKKYLLQRRYPQASLESGSLNAYLPKIELKPAEFCSLKKKAFSPKYIFVEKKAKDTHLAGRVKNIFPGASFIDIPSLKDHECAHRSFGIADYNARGDKLFIVSQNYDFFKKCPCTKGALGCGYSVFNLGFGCVFECAYCYLQDYTNTPGIILPANVDEFLDKFRSSGQNRGRIGSGEFSDSLALDRLTGYSLPIIEFFREYKGVTFEFKTKSNIIENLLQARHSGNIIVSWSLNPQGLIDENEFFTASLKERLAAALKCIAAGYRVGFHFDPVIYFSGWEEAYSRLIQDLFSKISPKYIAWISIGTFRFSPGLKKVIERRFPRNKILDEELLLGFDRKLRYPDFIRQDIYAKMLNMLRKHSRKLKIYLCMEELKMWKNLKLKIPSFIK